MDYFKNLINLLQMEKQEDKRQYEALTRSLSIAEKRENGMCWYPVAIRGTETGRGDYLTIELERTTHHEIQHQFRFGMTAQFFSNHDPKNDRLEGTISHVYGNTLKISLRVDELPDWTRRGKLAVEAVFDENSYREMENALQQASTIQDDSKRNTLLRILTGKGEPSFEDGFTIKPATHLNSRQNEAVEKMLRADALCIVHGPPGTGKTTTLVEGILQIVLQQKQQILVTAPSNAAVDLLTERLSKAGLEVVRVGNPARVQEQQLAYTLDHKLSLHSQAKEIKKMRKQAAEYRDLAQKYKRNFGIAEREQRKSLFAEARNLSREIERLEAYISEDVLTRAQVITCTLVGAAHYTIRNREFPIVVIDEAGQSLEPACWIPLLRTKKLIMAGDHHQLPPTIKSQEAAREFSRTLLEKNVQLHPHAVVLLEEQYRMNEQIMGFSSREFYGSRLKAHPSVAGHLIQSNELPFLFIDTAGCGYEEKVEGNSISNPEEAAFLFNEVRKFFERIAAFGKDNFPSVGLISPYRHQVEILKEMMVQLDASMQSALTVNTIDSFQGSERDAIFISLTRSNVDNTIGFLSEIRRINVAMTRARKKLVMIGDSATLTQFPFYNDLLEYAQSRGAYISAWELME